MSESNFVPCGGWNRAFSEQQRSYGEELYSVFIKKYSKKTSEMLTQMILFKQLYPGLQYGKHQEEMIKMACAPCRDPL